MTTQELIHAASAIASGMVAAQEAKGQLDAGTMNRIAQTSVELARKIEDAARKAYSGH
jgi:hypothetical protein